MKLHVVYRSVGRENRKRRPPYYSKLLCLGSFVRALERCPAADVVFLNDGEIPSDRLALMERAGEAVKLPPIPDLDQRSSRLPLYRSLVSAFDLVDERGWPATDLVYFAEDDYLYLPESFERLLEASVQLREAAYFAFYASIIWSRSKGSWVNDELWHTAESTTSTFGARIGALRADRLIHRLTFRVGGDTEVCLAFQGIRPFRWGYIFGDLLWDEPGSSRPFVARAKTAGGQALTNLLATKAALRRHLLVAPYRSLATHVELPYLATGTDWEAVAHETSRWLEGAGKNIRAELP